MPSAPFLSNQLKFCIVYRGCKISLAAAWRESTSSEAASISLIWSHDETTRYRFSGASIQNGFPSAYNLGQNIDQDRRDWDQKKTITFSYASWIILGPLKRNIQALKRCFTPENMFGIYAKMPELAELHEWLYFLDDIGIKNKEIKMLPKTKESNWSMIRKRYITEIDECVFAEKYYDTKLS